MLYSFDSAVVSQFIIVAHLKNEVEFIEKLGTSQPRQVARHIFLVPFEGVDYLRLNPIVVAGFSVSRTSLHYKSQLFEVVDIVGVPQKARCAAIERVAQFLHRHTIIVAVADK